MERNMDFSDPRDMNDLVPTLSLALKENGALLPRLGVTLTQYHFSMLTALVQKP